MGKVLITFAMKSLFAALLGFAILHVAQLSAFAEPWQAVDPAKSASPLPTTGLPAHTFPASGLPANSLRPSGLQPGPDQGVGPLIRPLPSNSPSNSPNTLLNSLPNAPANNWNLPGALPSVLDGTPSTAGSANINVDRPMETLGPPPGLAVRRPPSRPDHRFGQEVLPILGGNPNNENSSPVSMPFNAAGNGPAQTRLSQQPLAMQQLEAMEAAAAAELPSSNRSQTQAPPEAGNLNGGSQNGLPIRSLGNRDQQSLPGQTQQVVYNAPLQNQGGSGVMKDGVVQFSDPEQAARQAIFGNNRQVGGNLPALDPGSGIEAKIVELALSPLEEQYGKWWRDALRNAEIEGQPLELHELLQRISPQDQTVVVAEYWRVAEAIAIHQVHAQSVKQWQQVADSVAANSMVDAMGEMLQQDQRHAADQIRVAQSHLHSWLRKYSVPTPVRPVDSPFLGPYATKFEQLRAQGTAMDLWSTWSAEVDRLRKDVVDDEKVLRWAQANWEQAPASGSVDRLAASLQMHQRAFLLFIGQVTQYNNSIAKYSLATAGAGKTARQQVAMLLRQPIINGTLMDIRVDPIFQDLGGQQGIATANWEDSINGQSYSQQIYNQQGFAGQSIQDLAANYPGIISQVGYQTPPNIYAQVLPATAQRNQQLGYSQAVMDNSQAPANPYPSPQYGLSGQQYGLNGQQYGLNGRPMTTSNVVPSTAQQWQSSPNR